MSHFAEGYRFVFFDLETSGLYNSNPDIIQVGLYSFKNFSFISPLTITGFSLPMVRTGF
jgi:DNA polymerase III epsilon subunit-like protein